MLRKLLIWGVEIFMIRPPLELRCAQLSGRREGIDFLIASRNGSMTKRNCRCFVDP
jgi:hypothetical protein